MSLEEEHDRLHQRGELVKFSVFVVVLLFSVLLIAALRPMIFEEVVPAVLGWDQPSASSAPVISPSPTVERATDEAVQPVVMTETPPANETATAVTPTSAVTDTEQTYEVQVGDTLAEIATRFGVTVEAIVEANGIINPNRIQAGDVLLIPTP